MIVKNNYNQKIFKKIKKVLILPSNNKISVKIKYSSFRIKVNHLK